METAELDASRAPAEHARDGAEARTSHGTARRGPWLGIGSVLCAFGMCVATVVGSTVAGTVLAPAAVPIAVLALVLSAAAIALGVVAAIRGAGHVLGIVGGVSGILLNPAFLALVLPEGAS